MIERILKLSESNSFFLFGPRQSGKTTLIKKFLENKEYLEFNLLKMDDFTRLLTDLSAFRQEIEFAITNRKITKVFIDEIQKIPQLLDEVHYLIEKYPEINFIISGSSTRKIKRTKANMLAGRAWKMNLFPLSYLELKNKFSLNKSLRYGMLPKVYLYNDDKQIYETLTSYVETYLKEEIELEANIRKLGSFIRFLPVAASENGNITNFSNIGRDTGISYNTVKDYFSILEDTLLGFFLFPFTYSQRKRLSKHAKFYFFDTGVVRAITKSLKTELLPQTFAYGQYFEHFIILEIYKYNLYFRKDWELFYYRTEAGSEVDLIIKKPNEELIAIEIKSSSKPNKKDFRGLINFTEEHNKTKAIVVCTALNPYMIDNISIYPWELFINNLEEL